MNKIDTSFLLVLKVQCPAKRQHKLPLRPLGAVGYWIRINKSWEGEMMKHVSVSVCNHVVLLALWTKNDDMR